MLAKAQRLVQTHWDAKSAKHACKAKDGGVKPPLQRLDHNHEKISKINAFLIWKQIEMFLCRGWALLSRIAPSIHIFCGMSGS